ncbi:hypothetical protein A3C23_04065 [Candidatus Roizmanbacteria bacterium RIFCSPHIGHO2_02_FULL_37_13b]|nr:MAG: hypothetical protein A3C23_04065 [Candidatus Roizmanbacteria bacterium RIFCSPHIGHO2_02_FULL_37_13b]
MLYFKKISDNKPLNSFLGVFIEALFVTNLWILIYKTILSFLRSNFKPVIGERFLVPLDFPEPFEIPLYLVLSVLFVIFIFIFHKYVINLTEISKEKKNRPFYVLLKYIFFIAMIILFLNNIGKYPLDSLAYSYTPQAHQNIYFSFMIIFVISLFIIIIQALIWERILKYNKKIFNIILFSLLIVIIAFFTFEVRFPIGGNSYSYYLGPIWEVAHGKTIFTETSSQYGFLSILIFSAFYKLGLFNLSTFPVIVWILYLIQYFLCFYLIYKVSRSVAFSIIGLVSIVVLNYYSLFGMLEQSPQYVLRWLPIILGIFFLYKLKKIDSKKFILILSLLSLFSVDAGLYLIFTFICSLFSFVMNKTISMKRAVNAVFLLFLDLLLLFLIINLTHFLFGLKTINLLYVFARLKIFSQGGFLFLPIATITYFWLVMLIFFSAVILYFRKQMSSDIDQFIIFTTNATLFCGLYFVGNSRDTNLFSISIFLVLSFFLVIGYYYGKLQSTGSRVLILLILLTIFALFPVYIRKEFIADMLISRIERLKSQEILKPEIVEIMRKKYSAEINLINTNLNGNKILMIYSDDTYLFYLIDKENLLDVNPQIGILTEDELTFALREVLKVCPKKIAIDCDLVERCSFMHHRSMINSVTYPVDIQLLLLNKIESGCHLKYQPTICTNDLCIAQAQ